MPKAIRTAGLRLARGTFIGRNTILSCKNGDIVIGEGANIGFNCEMFSAARVELGARALLAAYCYVIGGDHDWKDAGQAGAGTGRVAAPASASEPAPGLVPVSKCSTARRWAKTRLSAPERW